MLSVFSVIWKQAAPVVLWTDALILLLVIGISVFAGVASQKAHLRDPWRQVARSRMGMVALVVLLLYVVIGLLDSIHFRSKLADVNDSGQVNYSAEVLSLMDIVMFSLRTQQEKTYSSPFATHLYSKETVERDDGTKQRLYPRLVYGGAHLVNPEQDRFNDIFTRVVKGIFIGIIFWLLLLAMFCLVLTRSRNQPYGAVFSNLIKGRSELPWRSVWATVGLFCVLVGLIAALGDKYHILGTDKVGQDVLYQSIKSIRTGLVIGTLTTLIMLPFAILLGITAGYFKGWIDDLVQYLYTTLNSIPGILLIAAAVLMMQVYIANHPDMFETELQRTDVKLFFLCVILGITSWTGLCRMLRGETLKLREVDYVQSALAFGVPAWKVLIRHIQPNIMHIVLIAVVLDFSGLVLAEAVLSYLGIGVDPTMHSWGNMINSARLEMAREPIVWWSLLAAFVFMFILVLAANVFSDAVRDAFDPRIRKR
ncbi:MAG: ABC transporter permease [Gammaproteobacteria bacterium]|nr:ABC transporter permease [Gammaproteobacteria bacterium]